ncbi:MAG: efflux RND transporter periplasmic adaptor subunit [Xanthobacteraceae bacterium]|nr:efflux RND transporter periplasmic adaptor subunit [Xanthobacteraceae bacterium]
MAENKTSEIWTISKRTVVTVIVLSAIAGAYFATHLDAARKAVPAAAVAAAQAAVTDTPKGPVADTQSAPTIELTETQMETVKVEAAGMREFPIEKEAIGSIDFNQDMAVQVFTDYPGRIVQLSAQLGDVVSKGEILFTIDSPDLVQAASNLISAAGVLELTSKNLVRAKVLYETKAWSQQQYEQAVSDQMTAEGALRAARDAVRIFGKTDAEMDKMIKDRRVDPILVIGSPVSGRISDRQAQPGLFVQPGNPPAPYTVADDSTMWMIATVAESDTPAFRIGQDVTVRVPAYPDHTFSGRITNIALNIDPNTRRVVMRSVIKDPHHELWAGMFARFIIRTGNPVRSVAVPLDGVVREGDGTQSVWVTTDQRRFTQRKVKIGLRHEGYRQILEGLRPGELVATDGAIFLSNMLIISTSSGAD